jgi:hypothetical protein
MCRARNQDWLTFRSAASGALVNDRPQHSVSLARTNARGTTVLDSLLTVGNQMMVYHEMVVHYEVRANLHILR